VFGLSKFFNQQDAKRRRVAIFEPDVYPSIENIRNGFMDAVVEQTGGACRFRVYNAAGCAIDMQEKVEELMSKDFDLLFSVGSDCTLAAKKMATLKNRSIPILFADVQNPFNLNLIKSYTHSGTQLTGVISFSNDYQERLSYLVRLQPYIKKALTIYNPLQEGMEQEGDTQMGLLLRQENIHRVPS